MIILISPAKKINFQLDEYPVNTTTPMFLEESKVLISELQKYKSQDISKLMKISPTLSDLNFERFLTWNVPFTSKNSAPAIFMFQGDVYKGINVKTFNKKQLEFTQKHLRILSGLHGILYPMDLIQPYRLEMGTKLSVNNAKNLYEFWDNKILDFINSENENSENDFIINLASDEYFKSVKVNNLTGTLIKPVFKDEKNGKYKVISFYAKKARGLMTRFIVENEITEPEGLKAFDYEGYFFNDEMSSNTEFVFTR